MSRVLSALIALKLITIWQKIKEAMMTLLENGMDLNCNQAGASLIGCDSNELT